GRGIQANLEVEDTHVTLTLINPDGQQESSSVSSQFVTSMLNLTLNVSIESIFETTLRVDVQTPTFVAPLLITTPTMTSSTIATTSQAPILPTTVPSDIIQNLPNFGSLFCFDDRLRSLEANFFVFRKTNQFPGSVSSILEIVNHYMDQRMTEVVKVAVQIQSDRLRDEAQRENVEFLRTVDKNMKKIIKEQVKEQVKTGGRRDAKKEKSLSQQALQQKLQQRALTGEAAPKPKASVRRARSSSDTSITPPTTAAASPRLTASAKGKQTARSSKAKSLSALFEVAMTEAQQLKLVTKRSMQRMHISQPSGSG
nr:hypothetical protein [Tanacetum cinerariifolium]